MELLGSLAVLFVSLFSLFSLSLCCNICLLSRLEKFPCQYRTPSLTATPGDNEIGEYNTRFSVCKCHAIRRGHQVSPIPQSPANGGSIFHICSPGKLYTNPQNYPNQKLVYYNVNCSAGQLIYFELSEMDTECTKCFDHAVGKSKCVDYIQVRTPHGNLISEKCGTDTSDLDGVIFPFDSILVTFRSSRFFRFPGFCATATCFNPQSNSRKKRASPSTSTPSRCQTSTHDKITIPYGHTLQIQNTNRSVISIRNQETNRLTRKLSKPLIRTLYCYYMNNSVRICFRQYTFTRRSDKLKLFPEIPTNNRYSRASATATFSGPGIFYFPKSSSSSHGCYQNYLENVDEYIPDQKEKKEIRNYNDALFSLIDRVEPPTLGPILEGDFDYITRFVPPSIPTKVPIIRPILQDQHRPFKRASQIQPSYPRKTDRISRRLLLSALKRESSSNPIVKIYASGLVKAVERENPEKVVSLRRTLKYQYK